jgi:hypothetical protein
MGSAKLYVESQGVRSPRPNPLPSEWYTTVAQGDCLAGVEFEPAAALSSTPMNFVANPPFITVELVVKPQAPEGE